MPEAGDAGGAVLAGAAFRQPSANRHITHADVDHCGLLDLYDDVYMSLKCLQNFEWERAGEDNWRERNPLHAPYVRISKLLSGYRPPESARLHAVGGSLEMCGSPWKKSGRLISWTSFEAWEGFGGHVAGETIWVERSERIALTGDVFVNLRGFTKPQAAFNRLAPFLMTSVDHRPPSGRRRARGAQERAGGGGMAYGGGARRAGGVAALKGESCSMRGGRGRTGSRAPGHLVKKDGGLAAAGEDQLLPCARHAHEKQPSFLLRVRGKALSLQRQAAPAHPGEEYNGKLQPLAACSVIRRTAPDW